MAECLIDSTRTSPNFNRRKLPISMIVLHYTDIATSDEALRILCDAQSGVSAHYLITPQGLCHTLVPLEMRAWHAGVSYWRGVEDVNSASIGIELQNHGASGGYPPFAARQIDAIQQLLQQLTVQYSIAKENIVAHQDIAPMRKIDPGPSFPWQQLAAKGLAMPTYRPDLCQGHYCDDQVINALHHIGYDRNAIPDAIKAAFATRIGISLDRDDSAYICGNMAK
ncbi:MAG: N-acetylmuramoyl-L-alanine amidase [Pseudomonadota bacterium]